MTNQQAGAMGERERRMARPRSDKRGSRRATTTASYVMHIDAALLHGAARNLSDGGAYVVTGEDLRIQLTLREHGQERVRRGRILRIEHVAAGTFGIAVQFDRE